VKTLVSKLAFPTWVNLYRYNEVLERANARIDHLEAENTRAANELEVGRCTLTPPDP
jgi:hypothetical protein